MSSHKHIQDELSSLQSNLPFNNNQPFSVPSGYFEGLATSVLAKIKSLEASVDNELQELSPLLQSIPKKMPYSVPFSYFQENVQSIPGILEEGDSTLLRSIGKEMPYHLPQGYFETVPSDVLARVGPAKAKVISMAARKWMRAAAAVIVAGVLTIAGNQYFSQKPEPVAVTPTNTTQTQTASVDPAIKTEIKNTSTKDLEQFLQNVQTNVVKEPKIETASAKSKVRTLLKDVSDEDMQSFLSDLPADDELFVTD